VQAALDAARADAAAAAERASALQGELDEARALLAAAQGAAVVDTRRSLEDEELFSTLTAEKKDAEARVLLLEGNVASLQVGHVGPLVVDVFGLVLSLLLLLLTLMSWRRGDRQAMLTEMEVVNERMSRAKAAEAEDVDADLQVTSRPGPYLASI
jgi:hypothetical protein